MQAIRIHRYGDAGVLSLDDVPQPAYGDEDVLIRVVAAGVNPVDWKIREGGLKDRLGHRLPLTLGWDVSGVVAAVGRSVRSFRPGDLVYSRPDIARDGCYAEYVAVRASEVALRPTTVSHVAAASLPLAVQLAKWRGAHVIATASAANADLVSFLGADEVIDYRRERFFEHVQGVDVVLDTVGGQVQQDSWRTLRPGGLLVSIVDPPSEEAARQRSVQSAFVFIQPNAAVLEQIAGLVDAGQLRPVVGAEFALRDAAAAQRLSQSGRARGKIVLYVAAP